jgi:hypothetical protein
MSPARADFPQAASAAEPWRSSHALPRVDLEPLTPAELRALFRGGETEADLCEGLLASGARARGSIDLSIAEGLHALRQRDRLARLGYHLDDYAREVLDLGKRTAETLAALGRELGTRPVLREAMRSGRVRLRAAETVLKVAVGEAEAEWVERAARWTVRKLEEAVRRATESAENVQGLDEEWLVFGAHMRPEERAVLDAGLDLAGEVLPGSSRMERLEALSQEFLAELGADPDSDVTCTIARGFRPRRPGEEPRRATLEAETEGWSALPPAVDWPAPDVRFYETATAEDVDDRLRELVRLRSRFDDLLGYCAHAVKRSGMHQLLGFASFRHYCEERLGLSARAVEQRAALEGRLWSSPALREARRQGVSFEKLRLLAKLPEREIAAWIPRARGLTCIALRRRLDGERERQMRAARRLGVSMPRRIAVVVAAAIQAVRDRFGGLLSVGTCLAVIAKHFIDTWWDARPSRSRSRKVRERDGNDCQVPGCSHRATHSHHIALRSHGGGDEPWNQVAVCAFHHLRCIHGGYLRVFGRAPDALTWFLCGKVWRGPVGQGCEAAEAA